MLDLFSYYPVCHLLIQAFVRTYNSDFSVGIEQIDDSASGDLGAVSAARSL
jgi:hypothetical protein